MRRYSLFLTPSDAGFTYVAHLIRELCDKNDTPAFEPHVTVYSGFLDDLDALKNVVSAAVSGIGPFSLHIRGIGCRDEYFRSLFLEFEEEPLLREIHQRMRVGVGENEAGHEFFPHLSLLYCDMPLRRKEALAKRVVPDRSVLLFDQVKIVTPLNLEEGWRDTGQWQTLFRVRLGEKEAV
jgi:putative hydrolase of the HAD superfamily